MIGARSFESTILSQPKNPSGFPGAKHWCILEECVGSKPENRQWHFCKHHFPGLKLTALLGNYSKALIPKTQGNFRIEAFYWSSWLLAPISASSASTSCTLKGRMSCSHCARMASTRKDDAKFLVWMADKSLLVAESALSAALLSSWDSVWSSWETACNCGCIIRRSHWSVVALVEDAASKWGTSAAVGILLDDGSVSSSKLEGRVVLRLGWGGSTQSNWFCLTIKVLFHCDTCMCNKNSWSWVRLTTTRGGNLSRRNTSSQWRTYLFWPEQEATRVDHDRVWKKEGLRSCGHIELDAFIFRRESCKVPIVEPKLAAFARALLLWVSDRNETHITRQGTDRICKCEKQHTPSDRRHSSNQLGMKRFKASSRHGKKKKAQWPPSRSNERVWCTIGCMFGANYIICTLEWPDITETVRWKVPST